MSLDHESFPHLLDLILLNCSVPTLLAFRATSWTYRQRVTALLSQHIIVHTAMKQGKLPFSIRSARGPLAHFDRALVDLCKFEKMAARNRLFLSHTEAVDIIGPVMTYALDVLGNLCMPTHLRIRHDAKGHYPLLLKAIRAPTTVVFGNLQLHASWRSSSPWFVSGRDKSVSWGPELSSRTKRLVYNVEHLATGPDFICPTSFHSRKQRFSLSEVVFSFTKASPVNRTFFTRESVSLSPMSPRARLIALVNKILHLQSLGIFVILVDNHLLDLAWVGGVDFATVQERQDWLKAAVGEGVRFLTREEYMSEVGSVRARLELDESPL